MSRYELPDDLTPEQERAVLAALERALEDRDRKPAAWTVGGRADALGLGALHLRHQARGWTLRGHAPFARRGTSPLVGRGDAR